MIGMNFRCSSLLCWNNVCCNWPTAKH